MKFTEEEVVLVYRAFERHSEQANWYGAILASAISRASSLKEAIELADRAYEESPTPPETTDDDEIKAQGKLAKDMSSLLNQISDE